MSGARLRYDVFVKSRAQPGDPFEDLHERFFARLAQLPGPWGLERKELPLCPRMRSERDSVDFGRLIGKGVRASIFYLYRAAWLSEDIHARDDYLLMTFNPKRVEYGALVREALPVYIEGFGAYRAEVIDEEIGLRDFKRGSQDEPAETRIEIPDERHGVYRVAPVSFYDETLCWRAFGVTPERLAARLAGRIEDVRLFSGGVYLIGSSAPLEFDDALALSDNMTRWARGDETS
ncbi:MAG: hypothetical protein ACRCT8_02920 [Lacipirellulaceae bacterium]